MKKPPVFLFLSLLFLLFAWGCRPLYTPNPTNIPLFSEAGEGQGNLSVGSNGYNLQLAWAPVEHLGLMVNANSYSVFTDSAFVRKFRHNFAEGGIGYWTRLNKYLRQELFVGVGAGYNGEDPLRYHYTRLFFQPNIGISRRYIDMGLSPKLSFVTHYATETAGGRSEFTDYGVFLEPAFTFRAGYDQIKFQMQVQRTFDLGGAAFTSQNWSVGFGIHVTLGKDFERYTYSYE